MTLPLHLTLISLSTFFVYIVYCDWFMTLFAAFLLSSFFINPIALWRFLMSVSLCVSSAKKKKRKKYFFLMAKAMGVRSAQRRGVVCVCVCVCGRVQLEAVFSHVCVRAKHVVCIYIYMYTQSCVCVCVFIRIHIYIPTPRT